MVPVEEREGRFTQHDEDCVSKFGYLGEHEEENPDSNVALGEPYIDADTFPQPTSAEDFNEGW